MPSLAGRVGLLCMVMGALYCRAQMVTGLNKDSLHLLLSNVAQDTNCVQLYITLGQQYETNNPDSALYYYKQAGLLSKKIRYPEGVLKYISNYTAVLNMQGNLDESIRLNLKAVEIGKQYDLKLPTAKAYTNLGAVYQHQENYPEAVKYYLKALPLIEQHGDPQAHSLLLINLCGVYRNMSQSDKAIDYARRGLMISEKANDLYARGHACINLGNCYKDRTYNEEAELYYRKAEAIALQLGDVNMQETALINLGNVYLALNLPEKYMPIFYNALPLTDSIGDISGKAFVLLGIGDGLFRKQRWKEAETHLQQSIAFIRQHGQKEVLQKLYQTLSDVYVATHRFDQARMFRELHDSVELTLMNEDILQSVQSLEAEYKLQQKQNELLTKDLELQHTRAESMQRQYWLIASYGGVVVLVLMLLLSYLFYRQRQLLNKQTIAKLEADQHTVRLQSLLKGQQQERVRISQEIHDDIGSGLTSMLFISRSLDASFADDKLVKKLTVLASSLIEKMNEIVWAMRGEPELLEDFVLHLRSLAGDLLGDAGIDLDFRIEGTLPEVTLPTEYRHSVYLVIKEAIHNCIKHSKASQVTILFRLASSWSIDVLDNGVGIAGSTTATGNGLRNMRKRITYVHGQFSISNEKGTRVHLELPPVV